MDQKKSIETRGPSVGATLIVLAAILATGCNKKKEECAAVEPLAASVRPKLDIDAVDDKEAAKKTGELGSLLESATSARAAIDKSTATDTDVRAKSVGYGRALGELITKTTALKTTLEELAKAAEGVEARVAADQSLKKARKEFMGTCNVADLELFGRGVEVYERSKPPMLAAMADALEKMKFSNDKAMAAAIPYAKAMRDKAAVLKDGNDLDAKLKELVDKSAAARSAFAEARTSVQQADSALTQTCATTK